MGKRVPLTREDTGENIGTAMVLNTDDPVKEFGVLARVDGVLVGLSITDPAIIKKLQGDITSSSFSIAPRTAHEVVADFFVQPALDGLTMAREMQDELEYDQNREGR